MATQPSKTKEQEEDQRSPGEKLLKKKGIQLVGIVGMPAKQQLDKERNGRKALKPYATSIVKVMVR